MTIEIPDPSNFSLTTFFGLLLLFAALDVATAVVLSVIRGTFSSALVMNYLRTHVLLRVFPIFGLGLVGHGIAALSIPPITAAWAAAAASLIGYGIETIGSLRDSFADKPAAAAPVPNKVQPAPGTEGSH